MDGWRLWADGGMNVDVGGHGWIWVGGWMWVGGCGWIGMWMCVDVDRCVSARISHFHVEVLLWWT